MTSPTAFHLEARVVVGDGPWACTYCGELVVKLGLGARDGQVHHRVYDNERESLDVLHHDCHVKLHRAGKPGNRLGVPHSDETRRRISATLKGRPAGHGYTPEVMAKIAAARRGKPHVEPQRVCECGKACHADPMRRHTNASGHKEVAR